MHCDYVLKLGFSTQMLMADLFSATPSYENNIGKHPLEPIRASNLFSRQSVADILREKGVEQDFLDRIEALSPAE